jgi:sterol desaturase/sphingolipid hydroxylase (fatty acid hydroxylase superfamily)
MQNKIMANLRSSFFDDLRLRILSLISVIMIISNKIFYSIAFTLNNFPYFLSHMIIS